MNWEADLGFCVLAMDGTITGFKRKKKRARVRAEVFGKVGFYWVRTKELSHGRG